MDKRREVRYTNYVGRVFIGLALLALLGAWLSQVRQTTILSLELPQLLVDAILLSLAGTGLLLDAHWDRRNIFD